MDIKIKTQDSNFKVRVAGALIKDGKLLTVKVADNPFYCLPGGHAHIGETLEDAIRREYKEEVGVDCTQVKLITFVENFFNNAKGMKYHELSFFYIVNGDIEVKDYTFLEHDEDKLVNLEFKWIDIDKLKNYDFRPAALIDQLQQKNPSYKHLIIKE